MQQIEIKIDLGWPTIYRFEFEDGYKFTPIDIAERAPVGSLAVTKNGGVELVGTINGNGGRCDCCGDSLIAYTTPTGLEDALRLAGTKVNITSEELD